MTKKSGVFILSFISVFIFAARGFSAQGNPEILISAAVSLTNAFQEIGELFKVKQGGVRVLFNFGGSGDLARQITGGAPVDVFASASPKDMDDLDQKDLIVRSTRVDLAGNRIVLITPSRPVFPLTSFHDLTRAEVKRVAIGNPKSVPAGRYAEEVFRYFRLIDAVKDKLIFAGNARQVLDYVARGEVDAGLVYSTDAMVRAKEIKVVAEAPEQSHSSVLYPIALIKGTRYEALAKEFISVVTSEEGKKALGKYGFRMVDERR